MQNVKNTSLTEGVIWKQLLVFAFPIFLSNLFQQLYNAADSIIVGKFLGNEALAAVSSSGNIIFMFVGFFNGTAMGAGVAISKFFGAKEYDKMQKAIHTDIAMGLIFGAVLTVVGVILSPHMLVWMNTDADILPQAVEYFRTYFFGVLTNVMYNIAVGILHAVGDSRHPLYYLIISSVLNIGMDILFVGVFGFGISGAAIATIMSQALSMALCFIRLMRLDTPYKVSLRKIRIDMQMLKLILKFGIPSGVQNSVIGLANVIVQSNINVFGKYATAGYGSYAKIEGFAFLPITCFSMGLATFISQNLGAKQYDRAKKGARFGISCSLIAAEIIGVAIWIFSPSLIGLFVDADAADSGEVIAYGVRQARTEALFYFLLAFSHCISGICRGAGKAAVPMTVMLSVWCVLRIIYITAAVKLFKVITVIYWAYPITWSISSLIFLIYYLKSDWIHGFDKKEVKSAR